jgi:EAL and modified HD-GYP domain-containing signal transduction protein
LEILSESGSHPVDFNKINDLVSRDVGLSYKLLKFINSPAIGVAGDIKSLAHAMTYLGEAQLRKFVSLVSLASIGHEKPPELLSLATVRARFCELLAHDLGNQQAAGSAFLCGLLSLIDAVMDDSLETVFLKLPIDKNIKSALRGSDTDMGNSLKLVIAYERGEWRDVNEFSKVLDITESKLGSNYREAICWARDFETELKND